MRQESMGSSGESEESRGNMEIIESFLDAKKDDKRENEALEKYKGEVGDRESLNLYLSQIPRSQESFQNELAKDLDDKSRKEYEQMLVILDAQRDYLVDVSPRVEAGENIVDVIAPELQEMQKQIDSGDSKGFDFLRFSVLRQIRAAMICEARNKQDSEKE